MSYLKRKHITQWVLLFTVLLFSDFACSKKERLLPEHPGGQLYHGVTRFDVKCFHCHGNEGRGTIRGPILVQLGKAVPKKRFLSAVRHGKGKMPAFGSVLKEEDILQIIDWLEKLPLT